MSYYVCKGAKLKCSMGSSQSDLDVIHPVQPVYLHGKCIANIMDHKPMINIKPFGQCKSLANPSVAIATAANYGVLKEMPCIPSTNSPWMQGKTDAFTKGQFSLLSDCKLMCAWVGTIEVAEDGQKTPNKVEINAAKLTFNDDIIRIIRIFWIDENNNSRKLNELEANKEVTICVEVAEGAVGKTLDIELTNDSEKKFKGGETVLLLENLKIENDNIAYVHNFKIEYEPMDFSDTLKNAQNIELPSGYYYTEEGEFLGNIEQDQTVYLINKAIYTEYDQINPPSSTVCKKMMAQRKLLYEDHAEFNYLAGVLYAEGSSAWKEAAGIYSVLRNRSKHFNTTIKEETEIPSRGVYGAKHWEKINNSLANKSWIKNAYKGLITGILSEFDYSNGAYFWDGKDFNGKNKINGGYKERYLAGYMFVNAAHDLWRQGDYKKSGETSFGTWDYKYESTIAEGNTTFSKLTDDWRKAQYPGTKMANVMGR